MALAAILTGVLVITNQEPEPENVEEFEYEIPSQGLIKGSKINIFEEPAYEFFNIPFAEPPVNDLRYAPPVYEPWPTWEGVRNGRKKANRCMQKDAHDSDIYHFDEDCLYLAVATNSFDENTNNPVLVYFHGGSFWTGTGDFWSTDMTLLANQGITVVSVNYRLGTLGFAGFESEFLGKRTVGNFGLMDQYAALQWVTENIKYFGGDPQKVTVFGESAGAESSMAQVLWEDSFQNHNIVSAIPISWPVLPYKDEDESVDMCLRLARKLDCVAGIGRNKHADVNCMREKDALVIASTIIVPLASLRHLSANAQLWPPTVDGSIVKQQPIDAVKERIQAGTLPPILTGVASEEGVSLITTIFGNPGGQQMYELSVDVIFHGIQKEVKELYPYDENTVNQGEDARVILSQMMTDYAFHCPSRYLANLNTQSDSSSYIFYWHRPWNTGNPPTSFNPMNCRSVACHTEIHRWMFGDHKKLSTYWKYGEENEDIDLDPKFMNRYPDGPVVEDVDVSIDDDMLLVIKEFLDTKKISSWPILDENNDYLSRDLLKNGTWADTYSYRGEFCSFWDNLDKYSYF